MAGKLTFLSFCILLTILSCSKSTTIENSSYSFYAVGHAYGNPIQFQYGIYPPLQKFFPFLNEKYNIAFGVFTGDVVPKPTEAYWDSAAVDLKSLKAPFYIAAGNHDRGEVFQNRFRSDTLFYLKGDAFVILNTHNWLVSNEQIKMIEEAIEKLSDDKRIFIFNHELVWWSPENEFNDIEINYRPQFPGEVNFWTDVFPVLVKSNREIFWISGDVGSKPECTPFVLREKENITFLANGVGSGTQDNVLIFDISTKGELKINAILFDSKGRPSKGVNLH